MAVKETTRFARGLESGAVSPRSALRARGPATATDDIIAVDWLAPLPTVSGLFDRLRGRLSGSGVAVVRSSVIPLSIRRESGPVEKYTPLIESLLVFVVPAVEWKVDCVKLVPILELPSVSPLVARTDGATEVESPTIGLSRIDSKFPPEIGFEVRVKFVNIVPMLEFPSVSPRVARTVCEVVFGSPN